MSVSVPPILCAEGLHVTFSTPRGPLPAVRSIDLRIEAGEVVALVGESGSGKSAFGLAVLGLLPPSAQLQARRLEFRGANLLALSSKARRQLRGAQLSVVFQDPMTALNPYMRVGAQIAEVLKLHTKLPSGIAKERCLAILDEVGLPDPARAFRAFPHELSGGMRQRALIAMALIAEPALVIADEPTTALDARNQAQVLSLLRRACQARGAALLLISHDLAAVAQYAHRTAVAYAGRLVEEAPTPALFAAPQHPYTQGLLKSRPDPPPPPGTPLFSIPGQPPSPFDLPPGCAFAPRCPRATPDCASASPELLSNIPTRTVACFHPLPSPEPALHE